MIHTLVHFICFVCLFFSNKHHLQRKYTPRVALLSSRLIPQQHKKKRKKNWIKVARRNMDFFEPCKYFKGLNLINIKETGRTEGQKCKEKRKSLFFYPPCSAAPCNIYRFEEYHRFELACTEQKIKNPNCHVDK